VLYAGATDVLDPMVSPRFATAEQLGAMPPTVVAAGEFELFLPECREFVDNLTSAGVDASLHVERHGQHASTLAPTPEGTAVIDEVVARLLPLWQ